MEWLSDPNAWIGFLTLTMLEIVLGIDNIIFISILAGKLPARERERARLIGLGLAMLMRILLLLSLSWIIGLTRPLFEVAGFAVTGKALILIAGGLFLLAKSTREIHEKLEGGEPVEKRAAGPSLTSVLIQIVLLDLVFSLDSVITAVGMVDDIPVMIAAVVIAVVVMMFFSGAISRFCRAPSDDQNAGLEFSPAHRGESDCGRRRLPHPERLHLLCDGLRVFRRAAQFETENASSGENR